MSSTLETVNATLCGKIFATLMILTILLKSNPNDIFLLNSLSEVNGLNHHYITKCAGLLTQYITTTGLSTEITKKRRTLYNNFIKAFHSNNTVGTLDRIFRKLEQNQYFKPVGGSMADKMGGSAAQSTPLHLQQVETLAQATGITGRRGTKSDLEKYIDQYKSLILEETYEDKPENLCTACKSTYRIDEKTSEYVCVNLKCGFSVRIYGEIFDDDQIFYQEGSRGKPVKYDPIKHCKEWIDRIQAKESKEIPDEILSKIKQCIRRDSIFIENLTYELIRKYLKELKITNYNNHIALIHKLITGINPIQFTDRELTLIFMYFSKAIHIFNSIKSKLKSNYPYYPFFIYKIVEHILSGQKSADRKRQILSRIHLLGYETLIDKDQVWFTIIEKIPEFKAVPTRAGAYLR
jgi:hypothetical protein